MGNLFIHPLEDKMPANLATEQATRQQTEANSETLTGSLMLRFLGTFRGWVVRYAVKLSLVASAATTSWLAAKWATVEQTASKLGADADTLRQLHDQGGTVSSTLGALVATLIVGAAEAALSRAAAKVAEQPTAPKALPTE